MTAQAFDDDLAAADDVSADKLDTLRENVREVRDLMQEVADLEERLKEKNKALNHLTFKKLPDLFAEARVERMDLPAEGNSPAYTAEAKPYYKANIGADWEDDRRAAAFAALDKKKLGDIIKTQVSVDLPRGSRELAKRVEAALVAVGVQPVVKLSVNHNTLTAVVKEHYQEGRTNELPPLDVIGAIVGTVVNVKEKRK